MLGTHPLEAANKYEIFVNGEFQIEGRALRQITDLRLHLAGVRQHIQPVHGDGAFVGVQVAGQNFDGGRLSGTVGTEQPDNLARCDVEGDPTQCFDGAV